MVEIKNGVHRWRKILAKNQSAKTAKKTKTAKTAKKIKVKNPAKKPKTTNSKVKTYFTHDNGCRPFKVVVSGKNLEIFTYTQKKGKTVEEMLTGDYPSKNDYNILIKSYKYLKNIFIPKGGNTILAHISGNKYLCIAEFIYEFETKNEKILEYHSHIGNSDVPYPLAIGETMFIF